MIRGALAVLGQIFHTSLIVGAIQLLGQSGGACGFRNTWTVSPAANRSSGMMKRKKNSERIAAPFAARDCGLSVKLYCPKEEVYRAGLQERNIRQRRGPTQRLLARRGV